MKNILTLLVLCILTSLQAVAQELTLQAHIEDATSGEALPYVSVYVSNNNTTIANSEGDFTIKAMPEDFVRFSYVGYNTLTIKASEVGDVIKLEVAERTLHQLNVMPTDEILTKVVKTLNKEYQKKEKKKAQYFCRLTTRMGKNDELTEAFIEASSAINLRDLVLTNGRRGQMTQWGLIRPLLSDVNFQHALELGPMVQNTPFWARHILPLDRNATSNYFRKRYSISCEVLQDEKEGKVYCFDMQKNEEKDLKGMLIGKIYVKAGTYQLLRFEGEVTDMTLEVMKNKDRVVVPVKMKVNITYALKNGFTEVEDMSCDIDGGENLRTQSIMHNVSDMKISFGKSSKKETVKENMLSAIDAAGFDEALWKHSGIIQRTAYEEKLAQQQERIDSTALTQHTGRAELDKLIDRARLFGERIPQEKVFLHLDNTSYFLGDTIWYAAYTRQTNNDLPSTISNVLYVELLNNDGYVMERQIVKMAEGRGHGNFYLNPEMYAGFYELRAYTRWNLNWGQYEHEHGEAAKRWFVSEDKEHEFFRDYDKLYSRVIPVYDAPTDSTAFYHDMTLRPMRRYFRKEPDKRKMQINFFPEGGNLIEGVENQVAFEAAWDDGEWLEGTLNVDGKEAKTIHRGRGMITVTPTPKYSPKVEFLTDKGEKVKGDWPKSMPSGVALHANLSDGIWHINAHATTDLTPDSLALVVTHQGMLTNIKAFNTLDEKVDLYADRMKAGVHQVTVFNNRGEILADRLIFVQPDSVACMANLKIEGKKETYQPFEQITLNVQATSDEASKQPISFAVRDAWNQDHLYDSGNMLTEMLLASEVKGFIPHPEWFFESDDEEHRQGLDLLMLTQGWRRFSWREMSVPGEWDLTHPDEKNIVIEGSVKPYMSHMDILDEEQSGIEFGTSSTYSDKLQMMGKTLNKELTVHAELVEGMTMKGVESELMTQDHRFRLKLPDFYDKSILFLSTADLSKLKSGQKYNWIQTALARDMLPKSNRYKFEKMAQSPDYMVYLSQPWPRYATPFNWYQEHLAPAPKKDNGEMGRKRFSDGTIDLNELSVKAKRNGMRKFSDSEPAFSVDAYDAWNNAMDAGFQPDAEFLVRGYIGDLGLEDPYVQEAYVTEDGEIETRRTSRINIRFGLNPERRADVMGLGAEQIKELESMGGQDAIDTLYNRKHLWSMERNLSPGELKYYFAVDDYDQPTDELDIRKLEKFVIYTDYAPRHYGERRYQGSDLPETKLAVYPYTDAGRRMFYRDRRYIIQGFNIADDFYHPDYSNRELPQDGAKDRRRTLYWNPDLKLDENGRARVTLYNCGREAEISITAEGMTDGGTILTGKE